MGVLPYAVLKAAREAVGEVNARPVTPHIGVARLVGIGGGDEKRTGQSRARFAQPSAVAGLHSHQHLPVWCGGELFAQPRVSHAAVIAEVKVSRCAVSAPEYEEVVAIICGYYLRQPLRASALQDVGQVVGCNTAQAVVYRFGTIKVRAVIAYVQRPRSGLLG